MSGDSTPLPPESSTPKWQPIRATDRRILGVLMEKAKTTPSAYPMTLNAIVNGANQKSNRDPVMALEADDAEESLERLRGIGAVGLIEGYGRVDKYRHYAYDWLGVDKVEFAVMAELLLRGPQTVGELRGRAARMEPIRDVAELRPIVAALSQRGLIVSLTPEGRGHTVTHALYTEREMERLRDEYAGRAAPAPPAPTAASPSPMPPTPAEPSPPAASHAAPAPDAVKDLRREMEELKSQIAQLRSDVEELVTTLGRTEDGLQQLKNDLGV